MTPDRVRLMGGIAAAAVIAGLGGFALARCTAAKPAAHAAENHGAPERLAEELAITPQAIAAAQIVVQQVETGGLFGEVLAQATVAAAPSGQAVLTAPAPGAVIRIYKRLGDPVRAGEPLAMVESREAAQIAAERSAAAAKALLAQRNLAREKSLYDDRVSPRADYEQAQAQAAEAAAEARRAQAAASAAHVTKDGRGVIVRSPITGRVTATSASLGAFVQPETELFRVADPARLQVEAWIDAADARRVEPGDRAILELDGRRAVEGRVRALTPSLDASTRAATAVLDVAADGLQAGQTARARILPKSRPTAAAIVVPDEAVQTLGGRDVVFVRNAQGFRAQPVQVTGRSAGRAEIRTGLAPGQQIATRNAFLLKAELGKGEGEEE
ncbi:MAG TPA: efflux RND transporter periplasmic adaptor subunit [Phenylobacterium sp.]|uniref:efflux RND transporter periplasmic adaptor subunit n=1 Tax=Phenylobacterium sp. TaxID=1871053 RepID=UPI002B45F90C|nr:efflux RND transporter periplasmic adaptor subunit [Phenylobacterium sp.]HKR88787.1 efflux RND transporter periplasmic adaptor subunit [Phenylobacterium sp.]